jgi:squalene-hopene/tetraprenyl-beta-curcumene cyclase
VTNFYEEYKGPLEGVRRECARLVGAFYRTVGPYSSADGTVQGLQEKYGHKVDRLAARAKYHDFPFLFLTLFGAPRGGQLRDLAVAGQLYAECTITLDKLMDAQLDSGNTEYHLALLSSQYRLRHALGIFQRLFESSSPFWSHLDHCSSEHACAVMLEKTRHNRILTSYPEDEMLQIAKGKQAPAKIIPAALAFLNNNPADLDAILASLDCYAIGGQLRDDLIDWHKDYDSRSYSYLLCRVLASAGIVGPECDLAALEVGRHLYFSGLADQYLMEIDSYFEKAVTGVSGANCPYWIEHVSCVRSEVQGLKKDLKEIRDWLVTRTAVVRDSGRDFVHRGQNGERGVMPRDVRLAASRGVAFLLAQQKEDYPEARHLEFARTDGVPIEEGYCRWGAVFSRALLLDALLAAQGAGLLADTQVIQEEVDKLLGDKISSNRAGWRYFPEIRTMPADAENLAQIVQVLVKAGKARGVCEESLHLLVEHNYRLDGAFDTWLSDPNDAWSVESKRKMQECWGADPNPEVVADVLYALHSYDSCQFERQIREGVDYLASRQESNGYWESRWYRGKYYGTYACSRILALAKTESPALNEAVEFMNRTQNDDGGWGEPVSTPSETALGLLTLLLIPEFLSSLDRINSAIQFLVACQRPGGNWPASDFINIDLFRSSIGTPPLRNEGSHRQSVTFASSTISTSFCVKALVGAWGSLVQAM